MPPKRPVDGDSGASAPQNASKRRKPGERIEWLKHADSMRYIIAQRALARTGTILSVRTLDKISHVSAAAIIAGARAQIAAHPPRWPAQREPIKEIKLLADAVEADQDAWSKFLTDLKGTTETPPDHDRAASPDPPKAQTMSWEEFDSRFGTAEFLWLHSVASVHDPQLRSTDVGTSQFAESVVAPPDGCESNVMSVGSHHPDETTLVHGTWGSQGDPVELNPANGPAPR